MKKYRDDNATIYAAAIAYAALVAAFPLILILLVIISPFLQGLGELARLRGDYERAGKFYAEHIEILCAQHLRGTLLTPSVNMAWVSVHRGDYRQAQTFESE
jgi:uncharacterized BrkB/YihY/UPF0761 family membrane protein